jgi:uncharacterized membrane protein
MFQTHCYDAWLGGTARSSAFYRWSRILGTLPAPLFLFLAGISLALLTGSLRRKDLSSHQIARATVGRGAEIFALGLLFRVQEYLVAWRWSPWTDLFRVDILNTIGLSIMLMGVLCWLVAVVAGPSRTALGTAAAVTALLIAALTPLLWTVWRPRRLPWPLESYVNGVHNLDSPQAWLFPVFPWSAFALAGLAVGFLLFSHWARRAGGWTFALLVGSGVALYYFALWLDSLPTIYPVYDFWHTSPNFFLARAAILLVILAGGYAWCRWGAGQWGFSPLAQLGRTSLLVYWVHIEFVYGRVSILPKRSVGITTASLGLLVISLAMLGLSLARTRLKGKGATILSGFRGAAPALGSG